MPDGIIPNRTVQLPNDSSKIHAPGTGWDRPLEEINAILRRAEVGNASALEEVKQLLVPAGAADKLGGNIARRALKTMVAICGEGNDVMEASTHRKLELLRAGLAGENPSLLEELLIDRVLATWLHLHLMEAKYADAKYSGHKPLAVDLIEHYEKTITGAQKRYLAAIKGLADVRKLALPMLQVNIAKNQVNVAASS